MKFSALLLASLLVTPAFADESGKVESGCKAGEGTAKFSVLPVTGKFVNGPQSAVSQMVNIINLGLGSRFHQIKQVLNRSHYIGRAKCHLFFRDIQVQLAVHAKTPHTSQAVTIHIEEFLVEQNPCFFQLRWVTRT